MNLPLIDARIIGRIGPYTVALGMHEVQLRDGSLHRLHRIQRQGGGVDTFLRAVRLYDNTFSVFDVCKLAPSLAIEIPQAIDRDVPGTIGLTFRATFATSYELRRAVSHAAALTGDPAAWLSDARAAA